MSGVAASAVVLGTGGTYVSGDIATSTQICVVRRELLLAGGAPNLQKLSSALLKTSEARTYMTLALAPQNVAQRREYAFLGVTAANNAISMIPVDASIHVRRVPYPTEEQLTSPAFMTALSNRVFRLDTEQLIETFKVQDKDLERDLKALRACYSQRNIGEAIGALSVLMTLLSLTLIGLREYHQAPSRKRGRTIRRRGA